MLSDWYFCFCIGTDPEQTRNFLSILDAFDSSESDMVLLNVACGELERSDAWMQIYALPHVMDTFLRNDLSNQYRDNVLRLYTNSLINLLPSRDMSQNFERLLAAIVKQSPDLWARLRACVGELAGPNNRASTSLPYLDLREFAPEVLVLAATRHVIRTSAGSIMQVRQEYDANESDLSLLVQDSLDHHYGRLALRLAAWVSGQLNADNTQKQTRQSLVDRLSTAPFSNIGFEPDLLQTCAEILFVANPDMNEEVRKDLVLQILDETLAFMYLPEPPESFQLANQPTLVFGTLPAEDQQTVRLIYWQAVLWELASEIDPTTTAVELARQWKIYEGRIQNQITIGAPATVAPNHMGYWRNQLQLLTQFHPRETRDQDVFIRTVTFRPDNPNPNKWLFVSPALAMNSSSFRNANALTGAYRYPGVVMLPALTRLMAASLTSLRLLKNLDPVHQDARMALAALLVHSYDVLYLNFLCPSKDDKSAPRNDWLRSYNRKEADRVEHSLPLPLTGLALFVEVQVRTAGKGEINAIEPELFVYLQRDNCPSPHCIYFVNFQRMVLPQVLTHWITEAYPGALPGNGPARWFPLLSEVLANFPYEEQKKLNYDKFGREEVALLTRFFLQQAWNPDYFKDLNWQTIRNIYKGRDQLMKWYVKGRHVLLTPKLLPQQWKPDWDESVHEFFLERAIERLASLKNVTSPDLQDAENWLNEWNNAISRVINQRELDRFTRLRLLEFIVDPFIENHKDEQELIALTLVERGSVYDQFRLLQLVFGWRCELSNVLAETGWTGDQGGSEEHLEPQFPSFQHSFSPQLRYVLLRAIFRLMEINETFQEQNFVPQSPQFIYQRMQSSDLFKEFLLWAACPDVEIDILSPGESQDVGRLDLAQEIYDLRNKQLGWKVDRGLRFSQRDVEIEGDQKIIPAAGLPDFPFLYQGIIYDPNQMQARFFYQDLDMDHENMTNLFICKNQREVLAFLDGLSDTPVYVLGVVTDKTRNQYTFHFGAKFSRSSNNVKEELFIGDIVRIPIYLSSEGKVEISQVSKINRIEPHLTEGSISELEIYQQKGSRRLDLHLFERQGKDIWSNVSQSLWMPDTSYPYSRRREGSLSILAVKDNDPDILWRPFDYSFMDLLLYFSFPQRTEQVTLAYINHDRDRFGQILWRFSRQPGANYFISPDDFISEDAAILNNKLDQQSDNRGLLVTVEPCWKDGRIYLRLAESVTEQQRQLFENLQVPFDDRNIAWRLLFENLDEIDWKATKLGGTWMINLYDLGRSVSGYPARLSVRWDRGAPYESSVYLVNPRWDEDHITVLASWEQMSTIRARGNDWKDFWEVWHPLKKGDLLTITEAYGAINYDGQVLCKTEDGAMVFVEVESLDMQPQKSSVYLTGERFAVVTSIKVFDPTPVEVEWEKHVPDLENESHCDGILIRVPVEKTQEAHCEILLKVGERLTHVKATLRSRSAEKWQTGILLNGDKTSAGWAFRTRFRRIISRALWKEVEFHYDQTVTFLGLVSIDSYSHAVGQVAPGEFTLLPFTQNTTPHLAQGLHPDFQGGLIKGTRCENTSRAPDYRARLNIGTRGIVCGFPFGSGDSSWVEYDSTRLWITQHELESGRYYEIIRKLSFRSSMRTITSHPDQNERNKQRFEEYIQSEVPSDKACRYINGMVQFDKRFFVPTNETMTEWTDQIGLAPGHGPFIDLLSYPPDGLVQLTRVDGAYLASFKKVKPLAVDQLYVEFGSVELGKPFKPSEKLYYAGEETMDPLDPSSVYREAHYRFEWGYGKSALIPKSRLTYNGRPFDSAEFVLFIGDWLDRVIFRKINSSLSTSDQQVGVQPDSTTTESPSLSKYSLDIIDISPAMEHRLYRQREKNLIHRLHLVRKGEDIIVERVEGFDDESQGTLRDFPLRVRAQLTEESLNQLRRQIAPKNDWVILARLQKAAFERKHGRQVLFTHVRLALPPKLDAPSMPGDFQAAQETSGQGSQDISSVEVAEKQDYIQWNELVFLRILRIDRDLTNDIGLRLAPPDGMVASDQDRGLLSKLVVHRRQFSVREDMLWRIAEDEEAGNQRLSDREVLVRFTEPKETSPNVIILSMKHGLSRSVRVLKRAIEANNGSLFASVLAIEQYGGSGNVVVEIRPGIFIRIPFSKLEQFTDQTLVPKDTVRIECRPDDYFAITRINPSQKRYLPYGLRPALALPMNALLKSSIFIAKYREDNIWQKSPDFRFTIGGLPEVVATPGEYYQGRWNRPDAEAFIHLMEKLYLQKIVGVGVDNRNIARLSPHIPPEWIAGKVLVDLESLSLPRFISVDESSEEYCIEIDWRLASFCDESAARVRERIDQATWRYHDIKTGHWVKQADQHELASPEFLSAQKMKFGPVFARAEQPELRYAPADFQRVGFPVQELIQNLRQKGRSFFTVAGVSDLCGLWIELAPGRLVEVPGQMMVWQSPFGQESLAALAWSLFATGDQVEFELSSSDPLAPDIIILRDWKPGLRHTLCGHRFFLPVKKFDPVSGALYLGAGVFHLTLPICSFDPDCPAVTLDAENHLFDVRECSPERGDVVLLEIHETEDGPAVFCTALPGWKPRSHNFDLEDIAFDFHQDISSPERLASMITSAGGALPVTIEGINSVQRCFYFSLRNQLPRQSEIRGNLIPAKVLGLPFPQEGVVLLQSGTVFWRAQVEDVISGLPDASEVRAAAARKLLKYRGFIWIRVSEDGELSYRIKPEMRSNDYFQVRALFGAQIETLNRLGIPTGGLICQSLVSHGLYWLPENQLSWFSQEAETWEKIMTKHPEIALLRVCLIDRPGKLPPISVIQTERGRSELLSVKVGKELVVDVVQQLGSPKKEEMRRYLVKSLSSGILLLLETTRKTSLPNQFTAEVIRRTSPVAHQVVVAPLYERPPALDIPSWMVSSDSKQELEQYRRRLELAKDIDNLTRTGGMQLPHVQANDEPMEWETALKAFPEMLEVNHLIDLYYYASRYSKNPSACAVILEYLLAWKSKNIAAKEMDAVEGIAAVLGLLDVGEVFEADALMNNISRRALRSMHSETLAIEWSTEAKWLQRNDNFSRRLEEIQKQVQVRIGSPGQDESDRQNEKLKLLVSFCRAVDVCHISDLHYAAIGLSATVGNVSVGEIEHLRDSAPTITRLTVMLNTPGCQENWALSANQHRLRRWLVNMIRSKNRLVLLDPFMLDWEEKGKPSE